MNNKLQPPTKTDDTKSILELIKETSGFDRTDIGWFSFAAIFAAIAVALSYVIAYLTHPSNGLAEFWWQPPTAVVCGIAILGFTVLTTAIVAFRLKPPS